MKKFVNTISASELIGLLSNRNFLFFIISVFLSQIATNMMQIVLILQIFYLTSSNLLVSILLLFIMLPQIFLSFLGGIVADRKDKKSLLFYSNIIRGIFILALFFISSSVPIIYFITLIVTVVTQFYVPAETPIIPKLVKKENLTAANSIFSVALFGSVLLGYVLAGPLITILGRNSIFILISGFLLAASFFVYLIPVDLIKNTATTLKIRPPYEYSFYMINNFVRENIKDTFSLLKRTKGVVGAFILLMVSQTIVLILATVVPGYAKTILNIPAEDLSLLLFGPAALGMIISSLIIGSLLRDVNKSKLMTIGIFMSSVVLCLFPFTSKIASKDFVDLLNNFLPGFLKINIIHLVVNLSFLAGFANALVFVPSQTIIQEKTPEGFRSKVYGLLYSIVGIFSLIPIIASGGIADIFGVGVVLFSVGIFLFLLGIYSLVF